MTFTCKTCGHIHSSVPLPSGTVAKCRRCGATIARHTPANLHLTGALSLAALILYIPANYFPILRLEMYGASTENTVWQGTVRLFQDHDYVVAAIVFLASILIPLLKILGLLFLAATTQLRMARAKLQRTWAYRIIDTIGRWAMLDVFVLAILVSLVKLRALATILPGKGLFAFACVVVLTLIASSSFDPQLIWDDQESGS